MMRFPENELILSERKL